MSDKTEEATPKRQRRAREDGDSPISGALGQAVGFVVALSLAPAALGALVLTSSERLRVAVASGGVAAPPLALALDVLLLSLPLIAAASVAGTITSLIQSGGVLTLKPLSPDLDKLNVFEGLKRLVSAQRLASLARALATALLVGWLAARTLRECMPDIAASAGSLGPALELVARSSKRLFWVAALVGLALGGVDLLLVLHAWRERIKMSKDEVRREHKESEGDPELKQARERAHHELLASANIAAVRQATVVIVNPTHLATALHYDQEGDEAPRVLAHGEGDLAQRMIAAAHHWGVPVVRDVPLAHALRELEVDTEIPEALFEAVATVLRELWEAEGGDSPPR
jgi:flagellar biosynthesis protein FlhB